MSQRNKKRRALAPPKNPPIRRLTNLPRHTPTQPAICNIHTQTRALSAFQHLNSWDGVFDFFLGPGHTVQHRAQKNWRQHEDAGLFKKGETGSVTVGGIAHRQDEGLRVDLNDFEV